MTAKRYEILTKVCFLAAIASSMAYGKLGALNWLALTLGVLAGITAVSVYFYNSRPSETQPDDAVPSPTTDMAVPLGAISNSTVHIAQALGDNQEKAQLSLFADWIDYAARDRYAERFSIWHVAHHGRHGVGPVLQKALAFREMQAFLDEVVQLVERLSPICEVQVNLVDRHLTIRPAHPTHQKVDVEPIDLRSNGTSETVN